jgi:hypothetical protein
MVNLERQCELFDEIASLRSQLTAAQARLDALETFVSDVAYNAFHSGEPYQLLNSMVSRAQGLVAIKPKPET